MEQEIKPERARTENDKLSRALPKILETLSHQQRKIFARTHIEQILSESIEDWGLNKKTSVKSILEFLEAQGKLQEASFTFPSRKETRYLLGETSPFELAASLKPNSYLTHRGAMYIHGLIQNFPETIYVNVEQTKDHERTGTLEQAAIERAFKNNQRISNEIASFNNIRVCIVHGQKTKGLGVVEMSCEHGANLPVTDLERTLIDITVRPVYAGGAAEVLKAYRQAKDRISMDNLVKTLKKMAYVYPYHQAIGFYLEMSGWGESKLKKLRNIQIDFDFYLEHKMKHPKYSESWKLFYPKEVV